MGVGPGAGRDPRRGPGVPWQSRARAAAQRLGVDPRYLRRLRWLHKAAVVRRSRAGLMRHLRFVLLDPEPDNFTFEISNLDELARWVATVACCSPAEAGRLVEEPARDAELGTRLRRATAGRRLWTKSSPPFGKRLGWYALARALRPRTAIEVGAHDGLGSLLLLRALERNRDDGQPGRLVSFDVNPRAGWLVEDRRLWDLRIASSDQGLPAALEEVGELGLFVYDGWHVYEQERRDLALAAEHLAPAGVLLSDDAQITHALADLCAERGLRYAEFHEKPIGHFHPGSALGAGRRG